MRVNSGSPPTEKWGYLKVPASRARLTELEGADDRADGLQVRLEALRVELTTSAEELSSARSLAAADFGTRVTAELSHLAMGKAVVQVGLSRRSDPDGLCLGEDGELHRQSAREHDAAACAPRDLGDADG